ncbi:MAG: response regulator transcription factor [Cytophagales bacterium]|nr:response regulator transcription factor [Cytophagales bacterium]
MKDATITIIDDEKDILELLKYNFEKERANTHTFSSGYAGLEFIKKNKPDAVICDWMLEDIDGIEICKIVKKDRALENIPFIMLTARSDEIDAVTALELGADDFLSKPVRIKELISRVKKIMKHRSNVQKPKKNTINDALKEEDPKEEHSINFKNLMVDTEKYKVYIDNHELDLTYSEFKLIHLLANKPGKVFTRNQIIEKLNGFDYIVTERSIDVQIVGLRKKLGKYKDYLETVRGVGYRLGD